MLTFEIYRSKLRKYQASKEKTPIDFISMHPSFVRISAIQPDKLIIFLLSLSYFITTDLILWSLMHAVIAVGFTYIWNR